MISNMLFLREYLEAAKGKILPTLYLLQLSWTAEVISDECFTLG